MNNNSTSSEPPQQDISFVEVECFYADQTLPSDKQIKAWVESALQYLVKNAGLEQTDYELLLRIVDKTDSQNLNKQYRHKNRPTNVLSFPFEIPDLFKEQQHVNILGDIVICAPVVEHEAQQQHKTCEQHWAHMIIHGLLHLLGYDHIDNKDADIMESVEKDILLNLGYPNPYMELINE